MRHNTSFRRAMVLAYGAVLIFALTIYLVYSLVSPQFFARKKIDDLLPKGQIISGYIESTLSGEISSGYLVPLIGRSTSQWEATVWVVDAQGETLIRTQVIDGRTVGRLPSSLAQSMLPSVLKGQVSTHIGSIEDLEVSPTASPQAGSGLLSNLGKQQESASGEEILPDKIVAVAVPITYRQEVVGAVFMAQTMTEVMGGMQALSNTLLYSMIAVALLLLPALFFFASRISRPIANMRDVAMTMASGNLSVRADEKRQDEYGELGHALNHLSSELGATISKLELERSRLESLINGISEGIIALDRDRRPILLNPAVSELLSLDSAEFDLERDAPELLEIFNSAMDQGETVRTTLWRGDRALHISASPLTDSAGLSGGCVGILSDVTSAERLEQTRRDYVANVSHELRTPLTALRALMEPLRDGLVKTEEQKNQIYDVVLRETMRLSRLVNDMLELSRLQSGSASMTITVFEPRPLLELIRDTYSPYAEDYQQTFVYQVPDVLPPVRGNSDRTQHVLIALLDNAFKYTPEGGTVTLGVRLGSDRMTVYVSDTGVGISPEDLPHVFDRFYKADKSHHSRGTGLGLAIAYEIMKQLGEDMQVQSKPGEGSCFSFTLHYATFSEDQQTP